jgi:hypothetical protein
MNDRNPAGLDEATSDRLFQVRKALGRGGIVGLVGGAAVGSAGFAAINAASFPAFKSKLNKNSFVATMLVSAAIGSFLGATVYGKNAAQYIGDIFRLGSNSSSSYQNTMNKNEREIVETMEESFARRYESIQKAAQQKGKPGNNP